MKKIIILITVQLFLLILELNAQHIEDWIKSNEKVPVEKIYLHTDRDLYSTGDTIWLKSYITDSRSGRLIPGSENVYLQLTGEQGEPVLELKLMSINGQAPGHIPLPDTLEQGNYLLSGFTDYLMNFGNESFFYKTITIMEPSGSLRGVMLRKPEDPVARRIADVAFLPEGGKLLEGISNLVAFKAIDENGYGINTTGMVKDASGNTVVTFGSDYKGMGLFFLTPESGKTYYAVVNESPSFHYTFDSLLVSEGIKIQLVNQTSQNLLINILGNSDYYINEIFYLVNMHRGNVLFYQPVQIEEQNQLVKFDSNMFKGGINQLILLDSKFRPISEQLIFSDNIDMNELIINPDKEKVASRSELNVHISENGSLNEISNLSAAVVHEAAYPGSKTSQNILSQLLISSELKGFIETPADYFSDSILNSQIKQRLLMLTNGWSNYFWKSIPGTDTELEYQQKAGLELQGMATNSKSGEATKNMEITLLVEKDSEMAILEQNTDDNGKFTFSGLLFNDTAKVYIQAKKQRGRKKTSISLIQEERLPIPDTYKKSLNTNYNYPSATNITSFLTMDVKKNQYARRIRSTKPEQKKLKELTGDGHFRLYEQADHTLEIPKGEVSFGNIIDFLEGKVPGLDISGDDISLRGTSGISGSSSPLFLVDGLPLIEQTPSDWGNNSNDEFIEQTTNSVQKVKSIPIGDIEKVEILKSPQNLAIFGVDGANGVIAIYTRRGKEDRKENVKEVLEQKIVGYSAYREFYSPKYMPENIRKRSSDFRITLFWEPELILKNGNANLSFYTSDQKGDYIITVEGISETGKICLGSAKFNVE